MQQVVHVLLCLLVILWLKKDDSTVFYLFQRKEEIFLLLLPIIGDGAASSGIEPATNLLHATILSQPAKRLEKDYAGQILNHIGLSDSTRNVTMDCGEMFPKNRLHECTPPLVILTGESSF